MTKTYAPVTTPEELTAAMARTRRAQEIFSTYTQQQVLSQSGNAMLAQANERPSQVLQLLQ